MTKRELIDQLEALDCPDETPACVFMWRSYTGPTEAVKVEVATVDDLGDIVKDDDLEEYLEDYGDADLRTVVVVRA